MRAKARTEGITLPEASSTGMPTASSLMMAVAPATERRRSGVVSVPSMSETTALMGRSKGGSAS
jgi:hypothetical protein